MDLRLELEWCKRDFNYWLNKYVRVVKPKRVIDAIKREHNSK